MLPEFDLYTPHTLPETLALLSEGRSEIIPIAGGTNVIPDLRSRRHVPKGLIDISRLDDLGGVRREDGTIFVGGNVTIAELLSSSIVREVGRPLHQAASVFANPLVRNRATLAGNLVDASPAADTAPPLLVLDAVVDLVSQSGCRSMPVSEFFKGVRQTARRPDELLAGVRWPLPGPRTAFGYTKLGLRQADAIAVVGVAVCLEVDASGFCQMARIGLGSVAPTPMRALEAEACLVGTRIHEETIHEAAKLAAEAVSPISDLRASDRYRRRMVEALVSRLLHQAAKDLVQGG